jgi:glycosyltransferase involved in cell wall biosynthesis
MSVYNGERFLRQSIDSILNQTFRDFEFIIIDDGSTDGSLSILKSYDDSRLRIIENVENIGLTGSLNKGLMLARGKYLARQDDGDYSYPQRLEKEYCFLENNKDFGLVASLTEIIDENNNIIKYWGKKRDPELLFYTLSYRNCLTHSSVMFDRKLVIELGGYSEKHEKIEDYELWHRLSRKKKVFLMPEYLVQWRKSPAGISIKHRDKQQNYVREAVIKNYGIRREIINYLRYETTGESLVIKIRMLKDLYKFHSTIKREGSDLRIDKKKLNIIFRKIFKKFLFDNFIGMRLKNTIKKLIRNRKPAI